MNNNHRITLNTNKNIIVEFTNERIIPASGLAVVGALLGKSDFIKKLNRMDVTSNRDPDKQVRLELWAYNPKQFSEDNSADDISLVLSFKDTNDKRIEEAVDELQERRLHE